MSYGQHLTKQYLTTILGAEFYENFRPSWLQGMELDFFFPKLGIAIEFNGDQHYIKTEMGCPAAQKQRDKRKRLLCKDRGIKLLTLKAADLLGSRIRMKIKRAGSFKMLPHVKMTKLDADSKRYRKTLIARFDSPTARRKGCQTWRDAMNLAKERTIPLANASRELTTSRPCNQPTNSPKT